MMRGMLKSERVYGANREIGEVKFWSIVDKQKEPLILVS
jgi:hypothetical protein